MAVNNPNSATRVCHALLVNPVGLLVLSDSDMNRSASKSLFTSSNLSLTPTQVSFTLSLHPLYCRSSDESTTKTTHIILRIEIFIVDVQRNRTGFNRLVRHRFYTTEIIHDKPKRGEFLNPQFSFYFSFLYLLIFYLFNHYYPLGFTDWIYLQKS